MKRWGKSPPLQAQARRHGKPHRVQGQIGDPGAARSTSRASAAGPGSWPLRQMILSPGARAPGQTEFGLQPFRNHFCDRTSDSEPRTQRPPFGVRGSGFNVQNSALSTLTAPAASRAPLQSSDSCPVESPFPLASLGLPSVESSVAGANSPECGRPRPQHCPPARGFLHHSHAVLHSDLAAPEDGRTPAGCGSVALWSLALPASGTVKSPFRAGCSRSWG